MSSQMLAALQGGPPYAMVPAAAHDVATGQTSPTRLGALPAGVVSPGC